MIDSTAGIVKMVLYLGLGMLFKYTGVLREQELEGVKKLTLYLVIPAVLFLSFSTLEFSLHFIPVIAVVCAINVLLLAAGMLLYRLTGSNDRLLPLSISTMNFALIGLPLYEGVFGSVQLHHYTSLGVGSELYIWFVFYFILRWFLGDRSAQRSIPWGFIKSPIVWGIILGCAAGLFKIDLASLSHPLIRGPYQVLTSASALATPLILIFVGSHLGISRRYFFQSLKLVLIRLGSAYLIGYGLKYLILDTFITASPGSDAAFFLLVSLPAVFSVPILAAEYLEERELLILNNTIVLHACFTIVLFSAYALLIL